MATILNLDKRLETIVNLCDQSNVTADIGCDHGLVTAELILQEKAKRVVSTEISPDCLNKAIMLANKINILPFVSFRECDGFKLITKYDKIDQAVIAGMGGKKIIDIISNRPKKLWNFVLQPMNDVIELRKYLLANKFRFKVDKLIKVDDKYYNVMKVAKGKQKLSDLEIYFGFTNFRENAQVLYEYLKENYQKLSSLKQRFGELNDKNEEALLYITKALELFEPAPDKTTGEVATLDAESEQKLVEQRVEELAKQEEQADEIKNSKK